VDRFTPKLGEDQLLNDYSRLVLYLVSRCVRDTESADADDLIQSGRIGLLKAIRTFDEQRGVKFVTFAWKCITTEILREQGRLYKHKHCDLFDTHVEESGDELWECMPDFLSDTERFILEERFKGQTFETIAQDLGCSKQWINKVFGIAIDKLKKIHE
jgi:RNA polymerase sigma factor (sigma-70 family)